MKKPIKVLLFKEWKESPTYKIDKWFIDRKIQIEQWFQTELPDFELDYFEWDDSNSVTEFFTGALFFNEPDIEYRLDFILPEKSVEDSEIKDITLKMTGYSKADGEILGTLNKAATPDQLVPNLIIELVSEFKTENLDDEGKRKITNNDIIKDTDTGSDNEETEQPEEPTGEVQEEQPEENPEQPEA